MTKSLKETRHKPLKNARLTLPLSNSERVEIERKAESLGLSLSAFCRLAITLFDPTDLKKKVRKDELN